MSSFVERLDNRWYPEVDRNWDDSLFREKILQTISASTDLLDVGAGAGIVPQMNFSKVAGHVSGIDPDERVLENPYLHAAKVGFVEKMPFDTNSFDVVFADNVLEHLPDPESSFREIARVLRPGGRFLFKTPNVIHYMPTIARLTPHSFHRFINKLRGRESEDTFRTIYKANSARRLHKLAANTGFTVASVDHIESRPEYLRLSAPTYLLGYAYERLVNSTTLLKSLRILLIGEFVLRD